MEFGAKNSEINENIERLFSSILLKQKEVMGVQAAKDTSIKLQEEFATQFTECRGRPLFLNYLSSGRGHGPFTELIDGSIKYDLIGGVGPYLLGHSHPIYIKACLEAACLDTLTSGNLLSYPQAGSLSKALLDQVSESKLKHFWFAGSGSFSNDNALKMIWQKKSPAFRLLAFENGFAGRSVATQDITANPNYRKGMPNKVQVDYIPFYDPKDPEGSTQRTLDAIEETIKSNPSQHCAMIMELIQGEGGFNIGTEKFFKAVCEKLKSHELYVWIDEIQTFARTPEFFAFQYFKLDSYVDIVTVGKALQVCGTLFSEELNPKPGLIAGTFHGALSSIIASEKIIKYLNTAHFYGENGRIKEIETAFKNKLKELQGQLGNDVISYYDAVGTMVTFKLKDGDIDLTKKLLFQLFDDGVIAFTTGKEFFKIRFLLPLSLTNEQIDEIFILIKGAIKKLCLS